MSEGKENGPPKSLKDLRREIKDVVNETKDVFTDVRGLMEDLLPAKPLRHRVLDRLHHRRFLRVVPLRPVNVEEQS